ncbi:MAG: hypothetical protein BRC31_04295 [Actinobacteria bacterium QS_5_72_10]|nr:MAG: hypothetical protein BRC31_04295 [Actinobacteria bacterium QS_5_72_10]
MGSSDAETGHPYVVEDFTADEQALLGRHVTNLDRPVFALVGMPEVVKGALFARYSRSPKSLRRLLVDEFAQDLTQPSPSAAGGEAGRAERLYQRVFSEYGDDSVAQLGGAHVAVEQASNLLTKLIEWGRLAAYLEQSTRYIPYDDQPGGRWRYYRDPDVMASRHAEARQAGDALLAELRQVIPAFLTRVDRPDRGEASSAYLRRTRDDTAAVAAELLGDAEPEASPEVALVDWTPDADVSLVVGMLYPHTHLGEPELRTRVEAMTPDERARVVRAYVGERGNRRHKPGRALERVGYRFDICSDYGAFRDLQRHRMATVEWQPLSPRHGYDTPAEIADAGLSSRWHAALAAQGELWQRLHPELPAQSQYAVGFAYRLRYQLQLNARAAMHLIELRTQPAGHPTYRRIAQRMHRLIAEQAGHPAVAEMMRFADTDEPELERLEAERRAEARRGAAEGQTG